MKIFYKNLIPYTLLAILFVSGCQNSNKPEPGQDALILELSISELPNTLFSIDQEGLLVSIIDPDMIDDNLDLTALNLSFSASEGATAFIDETEIQSGESTVDLSEGIFLTIISEDGTAQNSYFIYLSEHIPLKYLLVDNAIGGL
jgi:hypothetical protein